MRDEREVIAHHEAGHAAMAWLCGVGTGFVNIHITADRKGGVLLVPTDEQDAQFGRDDLDYVRRRILISCAGLAADHRLAVAQQLEDEALEGYWTDQSQAKDFMAKIGEAGHERYLAYVGLAISVFNALGWGTVDRVAEILIARGELSAGEIAELRNASMSLPTGVTALADAFTA